MKRSSSSNADGIITDINNIEGAQEAVDSGPPQVAKKKKQLKRKSSISNAHDADNDPLSLNALLPHQIAMHHRLLANLFNGPASINALYQNDFDDSNNQRSLINPQFYFFNSQLATMNMPHVSHNTCVCLFVNLIFS